MPNYLDDLPLLFPISDTEENRGDSTTDAEQVTSNKWTPECLKLLQEHRIDPDSLDTDEEDDSEKEEDNKPRRGKISTHPMKKKTVF